MRIVASMDLKHHSEYFATLAREAEQQLTQTEKQSQEMSQEIVVMPTKKSGQPSQQQPSQQQRVSVAKEDLGSGGGAVPVVGKQSTQTGGQGELKKTALSGTSVT